MPKNTLSIFRVFYDQIPSLAPKDILVEMGEVIDFLETKEKLSVVDVENEMVKFGYVLWPWHKAHREFLEETEDSVGDHFVLSKLPAELREKYEKYREYGISFKNLRSGEVANDYFEDEERNHLLRAFIDAQNDLKNYADRQIIGLEKEKFLSRVDALSALLDEAKAHLSELKKMAENEMEHENLANEIKEKIKHFEHGLCLLAPEINKEEVEKAVEFFKGRQCDLNRMRGIHRTVEVDFYNE